MNVRKKFADRGRRVRLPTGFMLLCLGVNGLALAANPVANNLPEIEYASPDQSIWTTRVNERGEPDNPLFRVAAVLFAKAGIPWHGKSYPASRMFAYLQDGTAQFSMLVKAPALQDCCLSSKKPIATAEIRAYRRSGTPPVKALADLTGKQVITIRGYSYGGLVDFLTDERNRVTRHVTQAHVSAFRMLENGRADYVIDYAGPANEVLADEHIDGTAFDVLSRQDIHLVLARSYPDAQNVMDRLESIIAILDVDGILGRETAGEKKDTRQKDSAPLARPRSPR